MLLSAGQFYIVGAPDVIGATQRTIAPRGNVQARDPITTRGASINHEPVTGKQYHIILK